MLSKLPAPGHLSQSLCRERTCPMPVGANAPGITLAGVTDLATQDVEEAPGPRMPASNAPLPGLHPQFLLSSCSC